MVFLKIFGGDQNGHRSYRTGKYMSALENSVPLLKRESYQSGIIARNNLACKTASNRNVLIYCRELLRENLKSR